jgi:DNA-binding transcriptional regulator/RsmH inhibitor MraZ
MLESFRHRLDKPRTVNDHLDLFTNALHFVTQVLYLDTHIRYFVTNDLRRHFCLSAI